MTSYPIWELGMTLFISQSHKPPALHVSHCSSVSHRDPLSLMSRLTPLFSLVKPTHHDTVCDHLTYHLPIYTSVVKGSRCWLLRMSPIVPCVITQRHVSMTMAVTQCVSNPTGWQRSVQQARWLIYSLSYMLRANHFPCHVYLNRMYYIME